MIELILTETLPQLWAAAVASYMVHAAALSYALWLFYLAVMNLQRGYENKTIGRLALILGMPILIIGLLLDVAVNILVMTVVFLEIPREWLVTSRLQRHIAGSGFRKTLAKFICHNLLDTFDPSGKHC